MLQFAKIAYPWCKIWLKVEPDLCILKIDTRSKCVIRFTTYHSDIPTWISHHLSLVGYLEYNKILLEESVYRYEIAWVVIKDVSNPMPILYVDSSTGCGFFPSCPCVPTPNVHSDIWDCVESYTIHMILSQDWESLCSLNFKSHSFQTESHFKHVAPTYRGSTTLSFLVLQLCFLLRTIS